MTKIKVARKQNLVTYSSTALAVLLLKSCNLNDIDHTIISQSLNFDKDTVDEEKEAFNKTKAVMIAHEVTKRAYMHCTLHTYSMDDDDSYPNQAQKMLLVKNPDPEKKRRQT